MKEGILRKYATEKGYVMGGIPISRAREIYRGEKVEKLSANENQYGVSTLAKEAGRRSMEMGNFYPDMTSFHVADKLCEKYGVASDQILLTHGGTAALSMLGDVLLEKGDEVVMPVPTYQAYTNMIQKSGAVAVEVPLENNYDLDFEVLLSAVTPKTKLIILCNPNNPTGVYYGKERAMDLLRRLPEHVVLLVDEAYIHFTGIEDASMADQIREDNNLVVVQTFSKIYGMAGLRLGYVMANSTLISALKTIWDPCSPSVAALAAGEAALDDDAFVNQTLKRVSQGRSYITEELEKLGVYVYPSSTNFIAFDCGLPAGKLTEQLLAEAGVLIRGTFDKPRVTIGTEEQNHKFVAAMKKVLEESKK